MPVVTINGHEYTVPDGSSLLNAVRWAGANVPTLCYREGYEHVTSCMVCVVAERTSDTMLPACSAPAEDGMVIETDAEDVRDARRTALELLLSTHAGDCEAPCRRACPAGMNIPRMIRQLRKQQWNEALATVLEHIALPGVLGWICPAPCERACRRGRYDEPVAICLLKRFSALADVKAVAARPGPPLKNAAPVGVVGAGPAGLSAAYYLARRGLECTVYDRCSHPGGNLQQAVQAGDLPQVVLDRDVERIRTAGVELRMNCTVGVDIRWEDILARCSALVLACGKIGSSIVPDLPGGIEVEDDKVAADAKTLRTANPRVFAGGNLVRPRNQMAVRAAADGRRLALGIAQLVRGEEVSGPRRGFDSRLRDLSVFDALAASGLSVESAQRAALEAESAEAAVRESERCLHCDCRKSTACKLRDYADEYNASQRHFAGEEPPRADRMRCAAGVVYEPGKCIKCGICVRVTEAAEEELGLTFIGRGFDLQVAVPFDESLEKGLKRAAHACVDACPTGALAFE